MFGFTKVIMDKAPKPLATIESVELRNVLEQERIVADAVKTQMMLAMALNGTMRALAEKYKLPKVFELDRTNGNIFEKEKIKDG